MISALLTGLYAESTVGYLNVDMDGFTLIEGGADGADDAAAAWAEDSPMHSHNEHPDDPPFEHLKFKADWLSYAKAAGPIRNKKMLDEGKPDLVIAFHDDIDNSKGTKHMVGIAKKARVPAYVVSRA